MNRVLLCGLLACTDPKRAPAQPASVVLIVMDTTRADRLGLYGHGRGTSPVLDALAQRAWVFDDAVAQAAVTPVSIASILTGLLPYHHGLRVMHGTRDNKLDDALTTLAERFQQVGYRTGAFVSAFPATAAFGFAQGFDHFDAGFAPASRGADGVVNTGDQQRRADATTDAALAWLPQGKGPFFLWLHYFDAHDPTLLPPEPIVARFGGTGAGHADVLRDLYDAEVFFMDQEIGRLFAALPADTLVAVVADHGEGLGDHDWWSHGILYREQLHVPMLIAGPGIVPKRSRDMVRTIDLAPTLLELAGLPFQGDGLSLLRGRPEFAYADSINLMGYGRPDVPGMSDRKDDRLYALVDRDHKLILHQRRPAESEFYQRQQDPKEARNLWTQATPRAQEMLDHLTNLGALFEEGAKTADGEHEAELRALGYIR
jgi:arylsulfatase A-like enzyme